MKTPSLPLWQAIVDERDHLEKRLLSSKQRMLDAEAKCKVLERSLTDTRFELAQALINMAFQQK